MAFLDRLRPKPLWMHPDPETRSAAVRRLGSADRDVLASIARTDADPRIRRIALKKLDDPAVVAEVARTDSDEGVRQEASSFLLSVAVEGREEAAGATALAVLTDSRDLAAVAKNAVLEPLRREALSRLMDPRTLAQVAKQAREPEIRLAALERVTEPSLLVDVALKSEHKEVALAAVEALRDPALLDAVAARAKNRAAARRARARLEEMPPAPATVSAEDRRWKRLQLCLGLEALAPSRDWPRVADELARAREAWGEGDSDPELARRFAAACQHLDEGLAGAAEERAERERREQVRSAAAQSRVRLCEAVEALPGDSEPAALEQLQQAWAGLEAFEDPEAAALAQRFARAAEAAVARREGWSAEQARRSRLEEQCRALEQAAETPDLREARARWTEKRAEWSALTGPGAPAGPELEARLERAHTRLVDREVQARHLREQQEKQNLERLRGMCDRLEALAASPDPDLRDADRGLRDLKAAIDDPGPLPSKHEREALLARLKAVRAALYPKTQELREADEWKRWANVSAQEVLCRKAEALLALQDVEEASRQLRALEQEWTEVRHAPKAEGEALWARFKTARDEVRSRHQAHMAKVAGELAENLKKKEALCEQAEALAESRDWIKTAETLRRLQADWKTIGPVPRQHAKTVWDRFRKPCDLFFTRRHEDLAKRKQEWARNLQLKEALCEQAEALAGSTDWEHGAETVRRLRAEWKSVGPVKRSRSDAVWERFRAACDRFFERYRNRDELDRSAATAEREALCAELEALSPAPDAPEAPPAPDDLAARVQAFQGRWRQAGPAARAHAAELDARFAAARDRLVAAYPGSFRGTDLDPEANRARMEKLCARVERLVPADSGRSPGQTLAERLRDALATNTIAGRGEAEARARAAVEEFEQVRAAWRRLPPVPGEAGQALARRFQEACERFQATRTTSVR